MCDALLLTNDAVCATPRFSQMEKRVKTILLAVALVAAAFPAMACAPAPTCWMNSGREYLKSVCVTSARDPGSLKFVEQPEQIGNFVRACAKLGIKVKED